jgi:hypothetical protein
VHGEKIGEPLEQGVVYGRAIITDFVGAGDPLIGGSRLRKAGR